MEQLDPDKFFRTNRQTIINIESIVKIEPYFQNKVIVHIKPEHKEKILVSKEKMGLFQAMVELLDLSPNYYNTVLFYRPDPSYSF